MPLDIINELCRQFLLTDSIAGPSSQTFCVQFIVSCKRALPEPLEYFGQKMCPICEPHLFCICEAAQSSNQVG